jgi:peptide/nickel transport system substrate-binding protein
MGRFAYLMSEETGMVVNPKVVQAMGDDAFNRDPAGAGVGPYEIDRFAPGEEIVMKAKTDYWGGPVCIQQLRFTTVPGGQATLDAFDKGELQAAFVNEPTVVDQAQKDGTLAYSQAIGGTTLLLNAGIRGSSPATKDVNVRRAIASAIDPDVINQRVNEGVGLATSAVTWKDSPLYSGIPGPKFDLDAAKQYVATAKAAGWDGSLSLLCGDTPQGTELGITLSAMLDSAGMNVKVENVSTQNLVQRVITQADYEASCWGLNFIDANPWATGMSQLASDASNNRTGYSDPSMDTAIEELKEAVTDDQVRTALGHVQQAWNDTVPAANYQANKEAIIANHDLHGLRFSRDTTPMFDQAYLAK